MIRQWSDITRVNISGQGDQLRPEVITLEDGRYVILWVDRNGTDHLVGQIFNMDGSLSGNQFTSPTNDSDIFGHDMLALPDGGFVVSYIIDEPGALDRFRVDRYDADGNLTGSYEQVEADTIRQDTSLQIVGDRIWLARNITSDRFGEIKIEAFDLPLDGTIVSPVFEFIANTNPNSRTAELNGSIAVLENGDVVVAWRAPISSTNGIIGYRLYDQDGNVLDRPNDDVLLPYTGPASGDLEILTAGNNLQFLVTAGNLASDIALISSETQPRISINGVVVDQATIVVNSLTSGEQAFPTTTLLNNGGFAIFWIDSERGNSVEGQLFHARGVPMGAQFTAAGYDAFRVNDSLSATTLPDGRILLSWTDRLIEGTEGRAATGVGIASVILDPRDGQVQGTFEDDILYGSDYQDEYQGFRGNDILFGSVGADGMFGGLGIDTVDYSAAESAVIVNLFTGVGFGNTVAFLDRYDGIEAVIATDFNDILVGDEGQNDFLYGGDGADSLRGNGGNDQLFGQDGNDLIFSDFGNDHMNGGAGIDTAMYTRATAGVIVNLSTGRGNLNHAEGDTYDGIENVAGSALRDIIIGAFGDNFLEGRGGDDVLEGRGGGKDTLSGGLGADRFVIDMIQGETFIRDFSQAETDQVDLTDFGFSDFSAVSALMSQDGADTVITFDIDTILHIENVDMIDLLAGDFLI